VPMVMIMMMMHTLVVAAAADINECDHQNGRCSQLCDNSIGSYRCSCFTGFHLSTDGRTCVGEFLHATPSTLFRAAATGRATPTFLCGPERPIFCNSFYTIVQPPTLSDEEIIAKL